MKTKRLHKPDIWHIMNCLMVAVVMAFMAVYAYPLLVKVAAPLDSVPLPPAVLGLKLSSAVIGAFVVSAVSAIPAIARGLAPEWKYIVGHD
jgi:hypothetical protein